MEINWNDLVAYSEDSPSGLIWKVEIRTGHTRNVLLVRPGQVAGTKAHRKNGAPMWWQIGYQGRHYRLHRVLYQVYHGVNIDNNIVDHIDGNPFNNRIENLRLCSNKINSHNVKGHGRGLSQTGVYYELTNGCEYYVGHYSDMNGKLIRKRFSIKKLGKENALMLAKSFRDDAIQNLNSKGAGYTDRHGK